MGCVINKTLKSHIQYSVCIQYVYTQLSRSFTTACLILCSPPRATTTDMDHRSMDSIRITCIGEFWVPMTLYSVHWLSFLGTLLVGTDYCILGTTSPLGNNSSIHMLYTSWVKHLCIYIRGVDLNQLKCQFRQ